MMGPWARFNTAMLVLVFLALLALIGMVATRTEGGPLDPSNPPGATAGVRLPGTPIESLPYVISQPGHYYLTRNLTAAGAGTGIFIDAANVTLDLNGFSLDGANVGSSGIVNTLNPGVTVRNGTVSRWTTSGITNRMGTVDHIHANSNGYGIVTENGTVSNCTAAGNQFGVDATSSTVANCAGNNNATGFHLLWSTLRDCASRDNTTAGILADAASLVEGCTSTSDHVGIIVGDGATARGNDIFASKTDGILIPNTTAGATVEGNIASWSGFGGFGAGISVVGSETRVRANNVARSSGPGIYVGGSYNTIDENSALSNVGTGIVVIDGTTKNTVVRNSAVGNAGGVNYSFASGNNPGTVITANASNDWSNTQ